MPNWLGWGQAFRRAGPYGGFLGKGYDPFTTECRPYMDPGPAPAPGRPAMVRGVRFVNVTFDLYWDRARIDYDAWDTHTKNFSILKENQLPVFDQVFTALLEDLEARGLLEETLVLVTSEMGRTPHVNGNAGRDHWTFCYGSMLAGAGIKGGSVVGASDARAAYVKDRPVSTAEICATVYQLLGIDPEMPAHDRNGRPTPVALGARPVRELLA